MKELTSQIEKIKEIIDSGEHEGEYVSNDTLIILETQLVILKNQLAILKILKPTTK